MQLTPHQMVVLAHPHEAANVAAIVRHLRERHAERVNRYDDDALRAGVRRALARAEAWGLDRGPGGTAYVTLCYVVAPHFDEHPKVRAVLGATGGTPRSRLESLGAELSDADWADVRRRCGTAAEV